MKNLIFVNFALRFLGIGSQGGASNARRSLIGAVFGIGLSMVPLVVVLVVSDGMIAGIASRTVELGTGHIKLIDMKPVSSFPNAEKEFALKRDLKAEFKNSFFTNVWVQREGSALIIGKNGRSGGAVRAVERSFFAENKAASNLITVSEGSLEFTENNSVILGKKIAEKLKLHAGDTCRIITMKKGSGGKIIPRVSPFKVSGIVSSGYQELDALWVFIPLEQGLKILAQSSSLTSAVLSVKDAFDKEAVHSVYEELSGFVPEEFSVLPWYELNRSTFYSFSTTKNLLMFIMFLIALVASANISSALVMLVMERRREIAILKASGAHPSLITMAFLLSGFLTCLGGLLVGIPLGLLAAVHINGIFWFLESVLNKILHAFYAGFAGNSAYSEIRLLDPAYYLEKIPVHINFKELYIIALTMLLLSLAVCIIPAVRAGKEKPLSIMRKV